MRPRLSVNLPCSLMTAPLFADAGFVVDLVLLPVLEEDLHDEDDERSLDDHVVAQRKAQEAEGVEFFSKPRNNEREDEPDHEHPHGEGARAGPMTLFRVLADHWHVIPRGKYCSPSLLATRRKLRSGGSWPRLYKNW